MYRNGVFGVRLSFCVQRGELTFLDRGSYVQYDQRIVRGVIVGFASGRERGCFDRIDEVGFIAFLGCYDGIGISATARGKKNKKNENGT